MNTYLMSSFPVDERIEDTLWLNATASDYLLGEEAQQEAEPVGITVFLEDFYTPTHRNDRRLYYFRQLDQIIRHSIVSLPKAAEQVSQELLAAILEFAPHQIGLTIVVDEDDEASLVITAYWPIGRLHVEHFYHFPADDPEDTVVNFYADQEVPVTPPIRQWGWYSPAQEFGARLRRQLRSGQWPLK